MYVVVGAEGNNLEIRCDVVYDASANSVDVDVVAVHESHATQQKDSSADFAQ